MGTSVGNYFSYRALADIMLILSNTGTTEGIKRFAENSTHPSAALVMI